jgi:hypothetical protein
VETLTRTPVASQAPNPSWSQAQAPSSAPSWSIEDDISLTKGSQTGANGPSLGPILVENDFEPSLDGPNLSLSLDEDRDEALGGPQANDDFLNLFQDDFEKK